MPRSLLLLLFPALVLAQIPRIPYGGGFSGGQDGFKGDATFDTFRTIQVTPNAPYSGEDKEETIQTLADSTRSNSRNTKVFRDSQGRVRIEQPIGAGKELRLSKAGAD
jgi:hypothetical protein